MTKLSQLFPQRASFLVLLTACGAWFFGGVQISVTLLGTHSAVVDLLDRSSLLWFDTEKYWELARRNVEPGLTELETADWVSASQLVDLWTTMFYGAFSIGLVFGGVHYKPLGVLIGRRKAMALSVVTLSLFTAWSAVATTLSQLLILGVLTYLGVGVMVFTGFRLITETRALVAEPFMICLIAAAGYLGVFSLGALAAVTEITPGNWRWILGIGACPIVLIPLIWRCVPEPAHQPDPPQSTTESETLNLRSWKGIVSPLRRKLIFGIALTAVPLIGAGNCALLMIPWADQAGTACGAPSLKAQVALAWAITGVIGIFTADRLARGVCRRAVYFLSSLGALAAAQYAFRYSEPLRQDFLWWAALLGFCNGAAFGWLFRYLSKLFPPKWHSSGMESCFALGLWQVPCVFVWMIPDASVSLPAGQTTGWVFALGMIIVLFAPGINREKATES